VGGLEKVIRQLCQGLPRAGRRVRLRRGPIESFQHPADLAMQAHAAGRAQLSIERLTNQGMGKAIAADRLRDFGDDPSGHCFL
jgi:hypothetical protein